MTARTKRFGGNGFRTGSASTDLMGTVRKSPDGTMLAICWPSQPHSSTWMVSDAHGSLGYEPPARVAHWPVVGAVPYSPAAGMSLADEVSRG